MKNHKTIWKTKAQAKNITSSDMVARCILKAMNAKSEDKQALVDIFVRKAFSPSKKRWPEYQAVLDSVRATRWEFAVSKKVLGVPVEEFFDSGDEHEMFQEMLTQLSIFK